MDAIGGRATLICKIIPKWKGFKPFNETDNMLKLEWSGFLCRILIGDEPEHVMPLND